MPRIAHHLTIISKQADPHALLSQKKQSIGRVLLSKNLVTEGDLLKAQTIQRYEAARIGEILIGIRPLHNSGFHLGQDFGIPEQSNSGCLDGPVFT